MANQTFRVSGYVIDRMTKRGVPGLRVEAWDKDKKYDDFLGVSITDRTGRFKMSFDETYFREYAPEKLPDLYFKVYRGEKLMRSTEDSVLWNVKTSREITIDVEIPAEPPTGKDRITARQVFKAADFLQRSDFDGLRKEASDRAGTALGFITNMVMNTITKMDIEPLKVGTHKTSDVINQDVAAARKNLEAQNVTVNEVKPFKPRLNAASVADLAAFPVRLKPGQKVNLYEENGKVRYYSIVKERAPADIKAADVIRLENEVKDIRSKLHELDAVKVEVATEKASFEKSKSELAKEVDSMKGRLAAVDELKKESKITRQDFAQKDQQIASLEQEIKKLQEFRKNVEKVLKKELKPPPAPKRGRKPRSK